jgi:hypothetical protein
MTRKQLELRQKANYYRYIANDREACTDMIMKLYERIDNVGTSYKMLYRYRRLNQIELDNLDNDVIFMRWPSTYTDDCSDCKPVFNLKEIEEYIVRKKYPQLKAKALCENYFEYDYIMSNPKLKDKITNLQDMNMVSCFTESLNNIKMWNRYAEDSTGFCLAYNMKDIMDYVLEMKEQGMEIDIMPVRYVKERNKQSDIMLNHMDLLEMSHESEKKYTLTCMTKEDNYSYEEEWRLLIGKERPEGCSLIGETIPFIKPCCILLGENMQLNVPLAKKLLKVLEEKNILMI